jgi:outer membrane scaffolding protein for murein synthesis (MipA/OmpV family)
MAVLEGGIIALPNAPISNSQRGGSVPFTTVGHGDATLQTGVRLLFRGGRDWTVGVGALFGPSPTSDSQYGGTNSLARTHSRNYLVFTTEGRYVPFRSNGFEGWVGVVVGGVIIADRFTTDAGAIVPSVIGRKEVTIRTEGFVLGFQGGVTWNFAERWGAGVVLRGSQWLLPTTAQCSPIGDCATLTGGVQSFEAGLSIGYRIPL